MLIKTPIAKGCTRCLDDLIAYERALYASERDDFHSFFETETVAEIQRQLRSNARRSDELLGPREQRKETLIHLLGAQRDSPHGLWLLLLIQGFEPDLIRIRRALSGAPDATLDRLVVTTLLDALKAIPYWVCFDDLPSYVRRAWAKGLRQATGRTVTRKTPRATEPPPSAVTCTGADTDDTEVA